MDYLELIKVILLIVDIIVRLIIELIKNNRK